MTSPSVPLFNLPNGDAGIVQHVLAPTTAPEWQRWLSEIGFIPGERVQVMTRAMPGGDPLVVRVGDSTFALRKAEAACILTLPLTGSPVTP